MYFESDIMRQQCIKAKVESKVCGWIIYEEEWGMGRIAHSSSYWHPCIVAIVSVVIRGGAMCRVNLAKKIKRWEVDAWGEDIITLFLNSFYWKYLSNTIKHN